MNLVMLQLFHELLRFVQSFMNHVLIEQLSSFEDSINHLHSSLQSLYFHIIVHLFLNESIVSKILSFLRDCVTI